MSIRVKLFLTLLSFSLLPLLIAGLLGRSNVQAARDELSEETRTRIERIADDTRRHLVEKYAAILERDRALIEIDVLAAADALRRFDDIGPDDEALTARNYTSLDFDNTETPPPGMVPDGDMERVEADGSRTALMVSFLEPVFVPTEADGFEELAREAAVLRSIVPTMRAARESTEDLIRPASQYAALHDSGLHMSWPGKGGYPADFDPRLRPWYQAAITAIEPVVWVPPVIDAPTGQVRLTCSAPIYRDNGELLGVAAADVALGDILQELTLPEVFRENSQAIIVQVTDSESDLPPRIMATAEYDSLAGAAWDSPITTRRFAASDARAGAALTRRMLDFEQDSMELTYEGVPWVWTWERLRDPEFSDTHTNVLVGIALEVAEADAARVAASIDASISTVVRQNLVVAGGVLCAVVVFGLLGSRSISKPVRSLADTAQAIAKGDLDARATVETGDELQSLAESFNSMVPQLRDRMKVREALEIAREVQQNLLPRGTPDVPGIDIAAQCVYSDETGGDYFDFLEIKPGPHADADAPLANAVLVGDVTGHGIGAALLMTTARALIHARAPESDDLPEVLGKVNANLATDSKSGQFMTLFYLLIGAETGSGRSVRWTSAGHDAAIVRNSRTGEFSELAGADIPLGIDGSWQFHADDATLPPESTVVIGTDGIWEARDPSGEMFGKDRLTAVMNENHDADAQTLAQAILTEVVRFRDGGPQTDDITLVVLRTVPHTLDGPRAAPASEPKGRRPSVVV
ncbi:MAG: SpoIIE family protein phosphatase [Planctomycetota bacterium]